MPTPEMAIGLELKNIVRLSWDLLTKRERTEVAGLAVAMVINGFLQTFSLALLIPFIGLMLDPSALKGNARFATLDRLLGNPPPETLLAGCASRRPVSEARGGAATPGAGAHSAAQPADPRPRRGDECARHRIRAAGAGVAHQCAPSRPTRRRDDGADRRGRW